MKKNLNKINFSSLIVLLMLLSSYPYVFHILFGLPNDSIMGVLFFIIISLSLFFSKRRFVLPLISIRNIMMVQSFVWFMYYFLYNDTSYLVRVFFILLTMLALNLLVRKNSVFQFAKIYNYSLVIQGFLGVIAFFLIYLNFLHPLFVHYYSDTRYLFCYGITCSNAVLGSIARIGGFFDEPGALAFWGVFALLLNKLIFDNKKIEVILIISLLFTFSAAYFLVLPIYLLCFYHDNIKSLSIILLCLVAVCYIAFNNFSGDLDFAHLTTERFSGGEIRSTRYDQTAYTKEIFKESPIWGIGAANLEKYTEATDNPYEILAKDGIVGFIITYLPLIFITLKYVRNKKVLYSSLILFLDYMQRPFHINEMHTFVLYFYCSVIVIMNCKSKKYSYENSSVIDLS